MSKFFEIDNVLNTVSKIGRSGVSSVILPLKQGVDTIAAQRSLSATLTKIDLPVGSKVTMKKSYVVVGSKVIHVIVLRLDYGETCEQG